MSGPAGTAASPRAAYYDRREVSERRDRVAAATMDRDEVLELVRSQLAEILEIDAATISESSSFSDDLNADSLALIELVEALEEELSDRVPGFRIDDEDLEELRTVRDAVDYVSAKVESS